MKLRTCPVIDMNLLHRHFKTHCCGLVTLLVIVNQMLHSGGVQAAELTFELPDSAKQCFHEEITQGTKCTFEFQVVTGGQYDVDAVLENPRGTVIYQGQKKQFDSHTWTADLTGVYSVCFSNEFSTFSHKLVYMDFQVGEEPALPGMGEHLTAMTKMETSAVNIHEGLNTVIEHQVSDLITSCCSA